MTIYKAFYTDEQKIAFFNKIEASLQEKIKKIEEEVRFDCGLSYVPDDELERAVDNQVKNVLDELLNQEAFFAFDKLISDISDVPALSNNPLNQPKAA